ncbi:Protein of unknown function (DUF4232) [Frankia sp. EI5c]|nr:Protein of unknown function (DUF4232) [Frankia sp. EI5c]
MALPACTDGSAAPATDSAASAGPVTQSAGSTTGQPAAGTRRCATADLAASLPAATSGGNGTRAEQQKVHVRFRNESSSDCTVYGFPGAQLRTSTGETWDLVRSPLVEATRIVLAPGAGAHATLTYLPAPSGPDSGGSEILAPVTLVLTPPDERTSLQVPWTRGALLRQDGATHPGTYISVLEPGD